MGLRERLKQVSDGVGDIFTAPVGLIVDTARAITSDEYNPGFFGTFGEATSQAVEGLANIGAGLGFQELGAYVGDSVAGDAVRGFFNEAEKLYSSEFQRQVGEGVFGLEPGAVSFQRIGATALGLSGQAARGQIPNLSRQWQRAALRTPGQAFIEETFVPDFYQRSPEEQDQIKSTAWYNLVSGSIDAVARWFTDPGVLAGKGVKTIRRRIAFRPGETDLAVLRRTRKTGGQEAAIRKLGYELGDEIEPVDRMPMVQLKAGKKSSTYLVVRNSMMKELDTGDLDSQTRQIVYPDQDVQATRQFLMDQGVPEGEIESMVQEAIRLQSLDDVNVQSIAGGLTKGQPSSTARFPGTVYRPLQLISDLDEAQRYASRLYEVDPTDMPVIVKLRADGLQVGFEEIDLPTRPTGERPQDAAFFTLADKVEPSQIDQIVRFTPRDLDSALGADYPTGQSLNSRLYQPDGRPIEPDQLIDFESLRDDLLTANDLASTNPVAAEKFLLARQAERNGRFVTGQQFAQIASNHRQFQAYINWMEGKSMSEIRRVLFPNTPYGDVLALWLSEAEDYSQRRTILLAAMGYKIQDWGTLSEITQAKLRRLATDGERIARGDAPDEMVNAMLGLPSKWSDQVAMYRPDFVEELIGELEDQAKMYRVLDNISDMAPLRQLQMPVMRRATNVVRRTSWYQESPLARPIRAVSEMRPKQWVNVKDPMSDIQLIRQLEEAQSLGITKARIEQFHQEYVSAGNEQARIMVIEKANNYIIEFAAKRAGMTSDQFTEALSKAQTGIRQTKDFLESRKYSAGNRDLMQWVDSETGEVMSIRLPLLSTQLQAWTPLPNARRIVNMANRLGKVQKRIGQIPEALLEQFYQIWKPTVLLRGGWMIRVVSDEQLRVLAMTGSLLTHLAAISTGEVPKWSNAFDRGITPGQRAGAGLATITLTQPITSASVRMAKAITGFTKKTGLVDKKVLKYMEDLGVEELVSARASFGGPSEQTLHNLQALLGRDELTILDHLYSKGTGQWRSVVKGEREYEGAWRRVLVDQYGRDPLGRKVTQEIIERGRFGAEFLDDADLTTVVGNTKKWLLSTSEGKEILERMPWRARDLDQWVEDLVEEINGYTGGFDEGLLRGILKQKVNRETMEAVDEAWRPDVVHGEIVSQTLGVSPVTGFIRDSISQGFDLLGRLPTDTLSRQPLFKQIYAREMVRLEKLRSAQGLDLDESAISRMGLQSRNYAIEQVREYLYDLAEVSRFGSMVRFIMPFYPAWQEVLRVWGKLALQDPSVIARAKILWEAPNKANMIYTDQEGEQWIQFRLAEENADKLGLAGWKRYIATGGARFGKSSFNLVLNNPLPSVGPLIQLPVNEIVKEKPELEEMLRWLLPFGVSTDTGRILFSPLLRQVGSEISGPEGDRAYQRAFIDAVTWMDVEYRAGRRSTPPSLQEAHDVASKLNTFRLITRLASPAQPIFDSPLLPYFDIYRDLIQNLGPEEADEVFLNEYGNEFFAVTISRTVSKTGIPPTVEAEVARRGFQDLIEKYPEYGRLVIGDAALGEFSTAAFAAQLERPIDPNNPFSEMERTYRPIELDPRTGRVMEVDRRLGWQEYIQGLDRLDLERRRLGLPNLRVSGAEFLANAKRLMVEFLKQKYPAWWDDFNTQDKLKWDKRISAFKEIANSEALQIRADIQGLGQYLEMRSLLIQELNRRRTLGGASTLDATSNQDLANLWETAVNTILDDNIAFGPLYYRYLESDPVEISSGS